MVESKQFKSEGCQLAFDRLGVGATTLVLLHGYGEDKSSFHPLMQALGETYTCLAIDLPFHGKTYWEESQPCTPERFSSILQALLESEQLSSQPLALLGYSMGGRIALSLIQTGTLPSAQTWLLASDGFSEHPFYWIATQTDWGNKWFENLMNNPSPLLRWAHRFKRIGLVHSTQVSLTLRFLEEETSRRALYQRWTGLRRFRIQKNLLETQLKKDQHPITLIYGKKDKLIPAAPGLQWAQKMPLHIQVQWIDGGHRLLQPHYLDSLLNIILP